MVIEVGMVVFVAAMLFFAWKTPPAQAKLKEVSARASKRAMRNAAVLPQQATLCLQDDSSHAFLTFDRNTGAYFFNNCAGVTIGGTASVNTRGSVIGLQQAAPDRRLVAIDDEATHRGQASLQLFNPFRQFTIIDRNTTDNTCSCVAQ